MNTKPEARVVLFIYSIMSSGGILVFSSMSFQTILDVQSADVVGNSRMLDIL